MTTNPTPPSHPRLAALIERARQLSAERGAPRVGIVYPCDALAMEAAARVADAGIARPLLIGPRAVLERAAAEVNQHPVESLALTLVDGDGPGQFERVLDE